VEALTLTVTFSGVTQQSVPRLEKVSQVPPEAVNTAELKLKFVPVLAIANTCGRIYLAQNVSAHYDTDRNRD